MKIVEKPITGNTSESLLRKTKVSKKVLEQNDDIIDISEIAQKKAEKKIKENEITQKLDKQNKSLKGILDRITEIDANLIGRKVYFVSGFDWFGASSVKGNYDGLNDMHEAIEGSAHYNWDDKKDIIADILKQKKDTKIVLIGHSFGGDTAVEIANELNKVKNKFKNIELLVTLDSVGLNNDKIPKNVSKNINYIASGNPIINDGPNLAIDYKNTQVENMLRPESHASLDDLEDIQKRIIQEIESIS